MRNKSGFLIVNDYIERNDLFVKGRKDKVWLEKDGILYLFKSCPSNYEAHSEVIASQIAKQCGINMAEYDFAIYKGLHGVITKNFLKLSETIVSGDVINNFVADLMKENNYKYENYENHSIDSIIYAINIFTREYSEEILIDLVKMWVFDGVLMESDRNSTNWSLIKNNNTGHYKLAPIYDSSTIARLNNDFNGFIANMYNESIVSKLICDVKQGLSFDNNGSEDNFIIHFERLCESYTDLATIAMEHIQKIDVDKALDELEAQISLDLEESFSFMYNLRLWLRLSINDRKSQMDYIYNKYKNNSKERISKSL